jgi:hypothetical protein
MIVFPVAADPVGAGVVDSLWKPALVVRGIPAAWYTEVRQSGGTSTGAQHPRAPSAVLRCQPHWMGAGGHHSGDRHHPGGQRADRAMLPADSHDEAGAYGARRAADGRRRVTTIMARRFPPPRSADKIPGAYVVRDANGQALAWIYSRDNDAEAI